MKKFQSFVFLIILSVVISPVFADVTLPNIITSNMILQRNSPVPIWGRANAGEEITVRFAGQTIKTTADPNGKWSVTLKPMKQKAEPDKMTIAGKNTVTLSNILVGDVWLCSGQSNMEYPLDYRLKKYAAPAKGPDKAMEELEKPKPDQIRYVLVEKKKDTVDIQTAGWITPENREVLGGVSAAAYFFAKEVFENTNIPIGIISTSWGGTAIEEWTPAWVYEQSLFFAGQIDRKENKINGRIAGNKFRSMIQPIVPFALKGMLWYQGETNCMTEDQAVYPEKVRMMVDLYRSLFRNPVMPFYFVQISPYLYTKRTGDPKKHTEDLLPEFWEAQEKCLSIPHTGMVVTTDLVDKLTDIHPTYKWEVGRRLALIALAKDYREKVVYEGPKYKSMKIKGNKVELSFINKGGALKSIDGQPLTWFTVAVADGKFVPTQAEIKGKKVIVWSDKVQNPKEVRFAWNERAMPNLINTAGLPAVPFRTGR